MILFRSFWVNGAFSWIAAVSTRSTRVEPNLGKAYISSEESHEPECRAWRKTCFDVVVILMRRIFERRDHGDMFPPLIGGIKAGQQVDRQTARLETKRVAYERGQLYFLFQPSQPSPRRHGQFSPFRILKSPPLMTCPYVNSALLRLASIRLDCGDSRGESNHVRVRTR